MAQLLTKVILVCLLLCLAEFPTPSSCRRFTLRKVQNTGWYSWSCAGASGSAPGKKLAIKAAKKACGKQSSSQTGGIKEAIGGVKSIKRESVKMALTEKLYF